MKHKQNLKRIGIILLVILAIILIFTFIDYFFHQLSETYAVPERYFTNKVIFGTIIGFITYLLTQKMKPWMQTVIFSVTVSTLLQTRYYLEGYALDFVLLFLGIHGGILLVISYWPFAWLKHKK